MAVFVFGRWTRSLFQHNHIAFSGLSSRHILDSVFYWLPARITNFICTLWHTGTQIHCSEGTRPSSRSLRNTNAQRKDLKNDESISIPPSTYSKGSSDGSVCLWTLDTFTVLNTITLPSPVCRLAISSDSVFLLAACEDNQLYLHTLATGTQIHCLRGHKAKVVSIWLAGDNQRAVAGGADGRVYVFDMHSGCLVRTISTSHNSKVTGVKVTANDDFLITAGGNRITFWSFRKEDGVGIDELGNQMTGKAPNQAQRPHTASISCLDISRDGTTPAGKTLDILVVAGAMDSLINVWLLNTHELSATLEGHSANVTCLAISPNGLFVILAQRIRLPGCGVDARSVVSCIHSK
ncbi:hypothetical protein LSTR_LSTR014141 [Laodelphax striatellus]|uniref:Uncharacterized protein n=1 Tax=Laodelphax striatellus TaxID=195883 RepID=A0A482WPC3_LAOST|nr:hypothetical protein LSTR_LSTR014141 [Laodelphax striatellus]